MVYTVVFFQLLIMTFLFIGNLSGWVHQQWLGQNRCIESLSSIQKSINKQILRVQSYNKKAKKLNRSFIKWQGISIAALAAGNMPLFSRAQQKLLKIKAQQLAIKGKQQIAIQQAHLENEMARQDTLREFNQSKQIRPIQLSAIPLSIEGKPFWSVAPEYHRVDDFESAQNLTMTWEYSSPMGKIVKRLFPFKGWIRHQCEVSQIKKEGKWIPQLTKAF